VQKSDISISIIIPAYNEALRLPQTLSRLCQYLEVASFTYEIVVVLDGPTDTTRAVLQSRADRIQNLRVIDRAVNRGKGYTVREGMLAARGQIRLFSDADNSTDIAHFDKMRPFFDRGYDVVIASRNAKDAPQAEQAVPQAAYKRFIGQLGNRIVQKVAVPGIWDTQCGFKAFRAEAAERIFSQVTIERWGFDIEVLALARALNYKIGIIPAHWINDDRSHVRLSDYLRVLGDTFTVRRNFLTGKYDLANSQSVSLSAPKKSSRPANG
jgi:glycosyltransferase involved in cell wall biosynthesis